VYDEANTVFLQRFLDPSLRIGQLGAFPLKPGWSDLQREAGQAYLSDQEWQMGL
jgi:hypothetical protein